MEKSIQVVVVVDLDAPIEADEVVSLLPDKRDERYILRLTEYGATRLQRSGAHPQPVDWDRIGKAVEALVREARSRSEGGVMDLYVAGQGPLAVFTHLGYAFSKFTGPQSVVGRHFGGSWELLPLSAAPETDATDLLNVRTGFREQPAPSTGRVAIYIDTAGRPAPPDSIRQVLEHRGENLAELIELRSATSLSLGGPTTPGVARELAQQLPRIVSMYPYARGSALFVAGPTVLAFMVGRALNPTIEKVTWLNNYSSGTYEYVYSLPFVDSQRPTLPRAPEDEAAREAVQEILLAAIARLQADVRAEDLPPTPTLEPDAFVERLKSLKHEPRRSEEFELSISTGTFSFGGGLLEALRDGDTENQGRFATLLLLHEVFHDLQGIRTSNYFDAGRAGFVLEQVDFAADIFALRTLANREIRQTGEAAKDDSRGLATKWIRAVLFGIERFDLLQHGGRIEHLSERRLRRYLAWYLQLARAETVSAIEDVKRLLDATITAELAPLVARVDYRFDKEVVDALPATEFFAAVDGKLVRQGPRPGFEPGLLVEAVRTFNNAAILKMAHNVVAESRAILIPWKA